MNIFEILKNMGFRYVAYRAWYEFKRRTGILQWSFPTKWTSTHFIALTEWQKSAPFFFFSSRNVLPEFNFEEKCCLDLESSAKKIFAGQIRFFNGLWYSLGENYDWVTNPDTGFKFDSYQHWTKIEEFKPGQGDIKFVWEKSRFCYLYTIIRYDNHCKQDSSKFVINEIISWIRNNPYNCGPNYKCSQEIALRVLNWIFALYFYRNSSTLNEENFSTIINAIRGQIVHVEKNINFSRFTVRNNHVLTEALGLYTVGLLFPWLPESKRWKVRGKKFLIEEGLYQLYSDGAYLQQSFNYHRVVLQLYTWVLALAWANNDVFPEALLSRLKASVNFIYQHQDTITGQLPNYGANDGSLFFPLNCCEYTDYRPQLNTLHFLLNNRRLYGDGKWVEDTYWICGLNPLQSKKNADVPIQQSTSSFPQGGYYVLRNNEKFAFIRCCSYRNRPVHADNLHSDFWYKGHNILRDSGCYLYNTSPALTTYFFGTKSHNTIMLNGFDQMEKGPRFIWYKWSEALSAGIKEENEFVEFNGLVNVFRHVTRKITHSRTVRQYKNAVKWEIIDEIKGWTGESSQIWNLAPEFNSLGFTIKAEDKDEKPINGFKEHSWYSPTYGVKENAEQILFKTSNGYFRTVISAGC